MNFHPLADIFPLLEGEAFEALVEDIDVNGLREAIWLHPEDGTIIDGRNRYRACLEAGVEPRFRTLSREDSVVAFIISMNLKRRHLNQSQKAQLAVEIMPWLRLEEEAKQRQRELAGTRPNKKPDLSAPVREGKGKSSMQASKLSDVGSRYVEHAKNLLQATVSSPKAKQLWDEVKTGIKTLSQARRILQKDAITEAAQLPSGKFRVLYADPPWKYGDQLTEAYGPAELHYPTMTVFELCALPIVDLAEDNAVLFLWATAPMLMVAFPIIEAWGFKYKTNFVWDKVKHNMGHYNSVRHELLLLATRGSCTPDVPKLYDSVVTIERTEHSAKPPEFRQMIESLYIYGNRLELFARKRVDGWEAWGNHAATQAV